VSKKLLLSLAVIMLAAGGWLSVPQIVSAVADSVLDLRTSLRPRTCVL
jgi:hypothetical protein